jgi:hypothetical protein
MHTHTLRRLKQTQYKIKFCIIYIYVSICNVFNDQPTISNECNFSKASANHNNTRVVGNMNVHYCVHMILSIAPMLIQMNLAHTTLLHLQQNKTIKIIEIGYTIFCEKLIKSYFIWTVLHKEPGDKNINNYAHIYDYVWFNVSDSLIATFQYFYASKFDLSTLSL